MIIIPQLFNYRLIIGSLVTAILVLGSYSFVSYNTLKDQTEFLQQEQKLMETELSQMVRLYNNLEIKNNNLSAELIESRNHTQRVLDSLRLIQASETTISNYKAQIQYLKQERLQLKEAMNTLLSESQTVNTETSIENSKQQDNEISALLPKVEDISLDAFEAKALMQFRSGKNKETSMAKRVSHLEVCFSLSKIPQPQEVFIQVLNPKNNVVADKGSVNFGNSSLIYSKKVSIDNSNVDETICTNIESNYKERFTKGTYFINIFNKQKLLANTTIELD